MLVHSHENCDRNDAEQSVPDPCCDEVAPRSCQGSGDEAFYSEFAQKGTFFRSQVRLHVNKWSESTPWTMQKIELFREQYSGPYTGGRELPMSCGAEPGFSKEQASADQAEHALSAAACSKEALNSTWCVLPDSEKTSSGIPTPHPPSDVP
jgi:hypothetical protein